MQVSVVVKGLGWFILWTAFSFFAHYYARQTITESGKTAFIEQWMILSLLTTIQMLLGALILKLYVIAGERGLVPGFNDAPTVQKKPAAGPVTDPEAIQPCMTSLYLAHCTATIATNASIAFVNTGSAFTIKAFEPISTAMLSSMLIGSRLQTHVILSLPLVVSGALGFVWQPTLRSGGTFGLGMAFVSNILFGVRNINLKQFHSELLTTKSHLEVLRTMSLKAAACSTVITLGLITASRSLPTEFATIESLASGFFHITYTIISTCVILSYTSVVGHATCNLLKRILVAACFFLIGKAVVTSTNWIMGGVMIVGLAIYVFPTSVNIKVMNPSLSLIGVVSTVVILMSCLMPMLPSNSSSAVCTQEASNLTNHLLINIAQRKNELTNSIDRQAAVKTAAFQKVDIIKEPTKANQLSIEATSTNDLILEAYNIHQTVFKHIIGKYKKAVLVNVFQWFNKGDHLITIGQRKILQRMGIQLIYHCYYPGRECTFQSDLINPEDPDLVILIQGAGYIGHPAHEYVIDNSLKHFPHRRVMVFPISVCHPIAPCTEMTQYNEIFKKHNDVHLVLRDRYSYDLAKQYFQTTHNYLAPDSAFAVGSIRLNIVPVYDIIWLKRNDWESQSDAMPEFPKGITVQVKDWDDSWMGQISDNFWEDHQLRTMTGISYLARGKVIVSDRLHAHIMSQLMGKLNVVINSQTMKQEHYYSTWEQSIETSALVNNNKDALQAALRLLDKYDQSVTLV